MNKLFDPRYNEYAPHDPLDEDWDDDYPIYRHIQEDEYGFLYGEDEEEDYDDEDH